ncbi:SdiA-regulated domain-containing protein [Mucilaginibacter sp. RS28]|uniref:SdiA-regulated domain-containing protein n=1 Tax=Mucilaginibacter straminoryzae TaxID=2932774 RepID=A0A9X2BBQ5_9SPHI|nr:SdiA-regulated domain-containing protein [Mucilaginibacter straminoryzae]MCJ8208518.1 SdiA-regulated domain-containing protein [Mucilaginibacter straminoryzae]
MIKVSLLAVVIGFMACKQQEKYNSPPGYDLTKPVKYNMPVDLGEISGIAFNQGNPDMLYTEEDENGRVYQLKLGSRDAKFSTFKQTGDFEDIAICRQQVIMLQSKGKLYTFPIASTANKKIDNAKEFKDLLPPGEFEGMYADEQTAKVYVLCKHCEIDKTSHSNSGFIFQLAQDGGLSPAGNFDIKVKQIAKLAGDDKVKFHPSGISQNPLTKEWYVLSSVNKILVVLSSNWDVKQVYHLKPRYFPQPEGIAFDRSGNLYISNEGDKIDPGTVLKFTYNAK